MELPQSYTISKFFSYANKPKQTPHYLNGGCPICHEGSSWGSRSRLFYYLSDDFLYCYNCGRSWNPYWWVHEVSGMSYHEIREDIKDYSGGSDYVIQHQSVAENDWVLPDLPGECVNLRDPIQLNFYKHLPIVQTALNYCNTRRLFTAINTPKTLYVALNDKYHKNRLIIPFYNNNRIICYTSRKLLESDKSAKYLLKFNSPKNIFNIDKVMDDLPYIFLFEGQIDSMFIRNGIAVSGLTLTETQEQELMQFPFHKRIWILDNIQLEKKEVINKCMHKLKNGDTLFFYEDEFSSFKDLNEYCIANRKDYIDPELIISHSYTGSKGMLRI